MITSYPLFLLANFDALQYAISLYYVLSYISYEFFDLTFFQLVFTIFFHHNNIHLCLFIVVYIYVLTKKKGKKEVEKKRKKQEKEKKENCTS